MDTEWSASGSTAVATTFSQLPLRQEIKRALQLMGFHAPSPIQLKALPIALFGSDVIGQAKSGTGKTAVFGVTAVEHVLHRLQQPLQTDAAYKSDILALILAPTREIAMQIDSVLREIAAESPGLTIVPLIGGLPVAQDQKRLRAGCHIAVGTPGRVRWLIEDGVLHVKSIRLLVLDEVDKLLSGEFLEDIDSIVAALSDRRQTLAFSATFTSEQLAHVVRLMRDPQVVRVRGPNDVSVELVASDELLLTEWIEKEKQERAPELWLRHVRQFYRVVATKANALNDPLSLKPKLVLLASLLSEIAFDQCIVFCNDKFRAEALAAALATQGWPTAAITGAQSQLTRNAVMDQFRAVALRVLVSTDLTARGIDVDKVNFVVNLDLPRDPATYLHRVGRTGRFGGKYGLAVTLLTENEVAGIHLLSRVFKMSVDLLPTPVPKDVRGYVVAAHVEELQSERAAPFFNSDREELNDTEESNEMTSDTRLPEIGFDDKELTVYDEGDDDREFKSESQPHHRNASIHEKGARQAPTSRKETLSPKRDGTLATPPPQRTKKPAQHSPAFEWEERNYVQWLALLRLE